MRIALGQFHERTFHQQFSKWWIIHSIFKQICHMLAILRSLNEQSRTKKLSKTLIVGVLPRREKRDMLPFNKRVASTGSSPHVSSGIISVMKALILLAALSPQMQPYILLLWRTTFRTRSRRRDSSCMGHKNQLRVLRAKKFAPPPPPQTTQWIGIMCPKNSKSKYKKNSGMK